MVLRVLLCILLVALLRILSIRCSVCSRSLPSYYESEFTGGQFSTGGVQLLIPSWNFSCQGMGTIKRWFAHVTGNTSNADILEFQIFRNDSNSEDLYHLVYHNTLEGSTVNGSLLTKVIDGLLIDLFLPVRNGYIVGVYLPPNTDFNINLLYDTDGDTDVYYWENVDNRTCNFSLCSGKIMRNINLFIGWDFMDSALNLIEDKVQQKLAEATNYCQWSNLQCNDTTDTLVSPLPSSLSTSLSATSKKASMPTTQSGELSTKLVPKPSISSMSALTNISTAFSSSLFPDPSEDGSVDAQLLLQLCLAVAAVIVLSIIIITFLVLLLIFLFKRHNKNALTCPKEEEQPAMPADFNITENPSYHAVVKHDTIQGERLYCKPGPDDHQQYYEEIERSSCNDYRQIRVQDHYVSGNKLMFDPSDA